MQKLAISGLVGNLFVMTFGVKSDAI